MPAVSAIKTEVATVFLLQSLKMALRAKTMDVEPVTVSVEARLDICFINVNVVISAKLLCLLPGSRFFAEKVGVVRISAVS